MPLVETGVSFIGKHYPFLDSCELIALEPFGVKVVLVALLVL
ncbi:MAG: hypothetical protein RLY14_2017 [Planctomycetota bacterium]|jgi:hypothetical protein